MMQEIKLNLNFYNNDFGIAKINESNYGKWFVSYGPIFVFAQKLESQLNKVVAPKNDGYVSYEFLNYLEKRWANHPALNIPASEFWATTYDYKGKQYPVMSNRKSWLISRAWIICRRECGKIEYPDLFKLDPIRILDDIRLQRPPPFEISCNRLYESFGYPRFIRFIFETRLNIVK